MIDSGTVHILVNAMNKKGQVRSSVLNMLEGTNNTTIENEIIK